MTKINLYSVTGDVIHSETVESMEGFSIMKFFKKWQQTNNMNPVLIDICKTITEINKINTGNVSFHIQSVMVVDDEPTLRELFNDSIARLGHFVEVFPNAEEALVMLKKDPNRYNYIFTDNMMIGTDDGSKFAKIAKQINSKIKTFVVSGDVSSIDNDIFDYHIDGAIAKPLNAFAFSSTLGHAKRKTVTYTDNESKVA